MTDKVVGLKDEAIGKVTHNKDKATHGKQQRTGELKRKQLEEDDVSLPYFHCCTLSDDDFQEDNPFQTVVEDEKRKIGRAHV